MKTKFIRTAILAFSAITSISLSSCGGNEISNDTLVIGMECNYQPFNWTVNNESDFTLPIRGSTQFADGYDIQVAKYLSEALNKPVEIHQMVWDALVPSLQNGEINMVLAGMSKTVERDEVIDFTDPYLSSDLAFLIKTENLPEGNSKENPATYDELLELFDGETLICQKSVVGDDIIENYFTNNEEGKNINHAPAATTYPTAALDVASGSAFAMPAELPVIEAMTNIGEEGELSVLYVDYSFLSEDDIGGLSVSIGIKDGNIELQKELNEALASLSDEQRSEMMGEASARSADLAA